MAIIPPKPLPIPPLLCGAYLGGGEAGLGAGLGGAAAGLDGPLEKNPPPPPPPDLDPPPLEPPLGILYYVLVN